VQHLEGLADTAVHLVHRELSGAKAESDVFEDVEMGKQCVVLENRV